MKSSQLTQILYYTLGILQFPKHIFDCQSMIQYYHTLAS